MSTQTAEQAAALPRPEAALAGQPLPPPTAATAAAATAPVVVGTGDDAPSKRRWWWLIAAGAVLVALVAVGGVVLFGGDGGPPNVAVSVAGTSAYTDTGINVAPGDKVSVEATGTVLHDKDSGSGSGPAGDPNPALTVFNVQVDQRPLAAPHNELIAKIGDNGTPIAVGAKSTFEATQAGRLFLGINDAGVQNNAGSYEARVSVDHP